MFHEFTHAEGGFLITSCAGQAAVPVNLVMLGSNLSKGADFGALPVGRQSADGEPEWENSLKCSFCDAYGFWICRSRF